MDFDATRVARELEIAEKSVCPTPFLSERWPDLTWPQARSVAVERDRLRRRAGEDQIGYKLGWTSAAMREALGIQKPNWGTLWSTQLVSESVSASRFLHAKIEPELVYRVGADDDGAAETVAGTWALGLEIVDPRFPSFDFDWLDNTADNSSAAGIAVGDFGSINDSAAVVVTFSNGAEVREGEGSQAMGDPREAVKWLASQLATEGAHLRAGDLVFTGGLCAPFDLQAGNTLTLESPSLNSITLVIQR